MRSFDVIDYLNYIDRVALRILWMLVRASWWCVKFLVCFLLMVCLFDAIVGE